MMLGVITNFVYFEKLIRYKYHYTVIGSSIINNKIPKIVFDIISIKSSKHLCSKLLSDIYLFNLDQGL